DNKTVIVNPVEVDLSVFWDVRSGVKKCTIPNPKTASDVIFSSAGDLFFLHIGNGVIYNAVTGKQATRLYQYGHDRTFDHPKAFSRDGKRIVLPIGPFNVMIWDTKTGKALD